MRTKIYTSKEEWLADRVGLTVSATNVPIIMNGTDGFKTRAQLMDEKLGLLPKRDLSQNPFVQFGTRTEGYVADRFQLERPDIAVCAPPNSWTVQMMDDPELSWLRCTVDRYGIMNVGIGDVRREPCVIEIKTGSDGPKSWGKGVPEKYEMQLQAQLHITGIDRGFLCVLIRTDGIHKRWAEISRFKDDRPIWNALDMCELRIYEYERDVAFGERMVEECKTFIEELEWRMKNPPPKAASSMSDPLVAE